MSSSSIIGAGTSRGASMRNALTLLCCARSRYACCAVLRPLSYLRFRKSQSRDIIWCYSIPSGITMLYAPYLISYCNNLDKSEISRWSREVLTTMLGCSRAKSRPWNPKYECLKYEKGRTLYGGLLIRHCSRTFQEELLHSSCLLRNQTL